MLAKRPLNIQIGGHEKTNHWTDKVLPNIPALVDYLTMPIEKVIKAAQDGQPILGLLNETTASAASLKSNQDQSFGTKGRKIALILFEPDPNPKYPTRKNRPFLPYCTCHYSLNLYNLIMIFSQSEVGYTLIFEILNVPLKLL